ncbi:slowpoke-binding protein isoform X2 [Nematostella vectensis]|uniref:slowpoke-binding protein isoform X2 n=1 Tax=Nematostella vectensis TaxID=45351 RepID=UPI0013905791|nr:slowpoke-binding protein isoform X2 [Nematostella vectensis]
MEQIVYVAIGIGSCIVVLIVLWILCKCRRSRFDYTAIDEEKSLIYKWETEKLTQKNTQRDAVLLNCYYYLKDTKTYSVVNHLPEIGSRLNKHWFLVKNSKTRMDAVLAMLEWSPKSLIPCSKQTRNTLKELLDALEHPYLLPILSIDVMLDREMVIIIQPYSPAGSLKDIIYGSRPTSPWLEKYEFKGKGLTVLQIKNYGRQILEALIYLQERGLPSCSHVHSGNVYLIDGACRFSGYEYSLLGYKARLQPLFKKLVKKNKQAIDVLAFGHLLFEMAAGYELNTAEPSDEQMESCYCPQVVEVLNSIFFNHSGAYPYLEEIASYAFFKDADINHLKKMQGARQVKLGSNTRAMLKLFHTKESDNRSCRKSLKRRSRAASINTESKKEKKSSRSKSKRKSLDSSIPSVVFSKVGAAMTSYPPAKGSSIFSPPPPPPAVPPAIREHAPTKAAAGKERGELLSSIRQGTRLKKADTNDRSAPRI